MFLSRIAAAGIFVLTVSAAHAQSLTDSVQELAKTLGQQLSDAGTQKLAIASFTELNGNATALGDFVSEELTTALFPVGDFAIIERREYDRVIAEQELYGSGGFSAEQVPEIGKQLGVDAIISGSISVLDTTIRLNARAISVETTRVFAAASATAVRDNDVNILLGQRSMQQVAESATVSGSVPQPVDTIYENSFLRVTPVSVILSDDKRVFTVATEFRNLASKDIYLAYDHCNTEFSAATKSGETFDWEWRDGHMVGMSKICPGGSKTTQSDFSVVQPGNTITVVWKGENESKAPIAGNRLSLQGLFTSYEDGNLSRFRVVLDNIALK